MVQGEKVPLSKTALLKYYYSSHKSGNGSHKGRNGRPSHRDEFIRCTRCGKVEDFGSVQKKSAGFTMMLLPKLTGHVQI